MPTEYNAAMNQEIRNGLVVLVGAGPGDESLLTMAGATWISICDCVVYDRLANSALLELADPDAERVDVGKTPDRPAVTQEQINEILIDRCRAGKLVVRLKGGDPLIFGRGGEEASALADAGCDFRIVPGITAAIAAAAYAGIPLTDRRLASTVTFVTGHEDPAKDESAIDYDALAALGVVPASKGGFKLHR